MKLRSLLVSIRESLLFIPISAVGGFVLLAVAVSQLGAEPEWIVDVDLETSRSVLSVIASSTLTVAGIVISFLAITIQLASSNYTPRLVPRFLNDRFQQSIIGLLVGTFAFSVTSLADLAGATSDTPAPDLATNIAMILALASTVGIIAFIDHVARRLRVDDTIQRLAIRTAESFRARSKAARPIEVSDDSGGFDEQGEPVVVTADRNGWLRAIDTERLARSLPSGSLARLSVDVGDYVGVFLPLLEIWAGNEPDPHEARRNFEVNSNRDIESDPLFGIRQLVDIALRALSPGINDPTTAADVVRQLVRPLSEAVTTSQPGRVIHGPDNQRIYVPRRLTPESVIRAGLDEIITAASSQPFVIQSVLEAVELLRYRMEDGGHDVTGLGHTIDRVVRTVAESSMDPDDRRRLLDRANRLRSTIS